MKNKRIDKSYIDFLKERRLLSFESFKKQHILSFVDARKPVEFPIVSTDVPISGPNVVFGKSIEDGTEVLWGCLYYSTNKGFSVYEKDYDELKDYKGKVYVDEFGVRSILPHLGKNYLFDENGNLVAIFIKESFGCCRIK